MRLGRNLRSEFEKGIESVLEIANGDNQDHHVAEMLETARQIWKFRGRVGGQPKLRACQDVFKSQTRETRVLLESWITAGRSFSKWKAQNAAEYSRIEGTISQTTYAIVPPDRGDSDDEPVITRSFDPGRDMIGATQAIATFQARWAFLDVLGNPLRYDISVCDRCHRMYLNRSGHRNKRFCERRCTVLDASTRLVKKMRQAERNKQLSLAQSFLANWNPRKNPDWRQWTSDQTKLTKTFLTRALNRGELKIPVVD